MLHLNIFMWGYTIQQVIKYRLTAPLLLSNLWLIIWQSSLLLLLCVAYIMVPDLWFHLDSLNQFILTCISTGGPATTVTWTRDSVTVTEGTQTVLNDPETANYTHTLTETGSLGVNYTCTVTNNKPSSASATYILQGVVHKVIFDCLCACP